VNRLLPQVDGAGLGARPRTKKQKRVGGPAVYNQIDHPTTGFPEEHPARVFGGKNINDPLRWVPTAVGNRTLCDNALPNASPPPHTPPDPLATKGPPGNRTNRGGNPARSPLPPAKKVPRPLSVPPGFPPWRENLPRAQGPLFWVSSNGPPGAPKAGVPDERAPKKLPLFYRQWAFGAPPKWWPVGGPPAFGHPRRVFFSPFFSTDPQRRCVLAKVRPYRLSRFALVFGPLSAFVLS